MLTPYNTCTLYVAPSCGSDTIFTGVKPLPDGLGGGPFATVWRAMKAVGEARATGDRRPFTVQLCEDIHLEAPIQITGCIDKRCAEGAVYAGGWGVTIRSAPGKRCRVVGGIKISGWESTTFNGQNCLAARLPERADGYQFTELLVNGRRADRTRWPRTGVLHALKTENPDIDHFHTSSKWFDIDPSLLDGVSNVQDAIINFCHYWIDEHTPVESYDVSTGHMVMKYASRMTISTIYEPEHASALRWYLEGVPETFEQPGQWYLDRAASTVYYLPLPGETADGIEVFAPLTDRLFDICGTKEKPIEDIRLVNLELLCTESNYASRWKWGIGDTAEEENLTFASDIQSACWTGAAVNLQYANRCTVENCLLWGLGQYAIEIGSGCRANRILHNTMQDLGAGGIKVYGATAEQLAEDPGLQPTVGNLLRGNTITYCGKRHEAGCGILIIHSAENEVCENDISYLGYTGISVGWVWGYAPSSSYGNHISYNHIHHVGTGSLSDMGGIYLLGHQQGTVVEYNRIHDVTSAHYGGWGIYTDEGSSHITIENNVVFRTKCESFHQHYGSDNHLRNNIFVDGDGALRFSRPESHCGAVLEQNILVTKGEPLCGPESRMQPMLSQNNLIWNGTDCPVMVDGFGLKLNFADWQKAGKDAGSMAADPCFTDAAQDDYTLLPNSPALALGFEPITGFPAVEKR